MALIKFYELWCMWFQFSKRPKNSAGFLHDIMFSNPNERRNEVTSVNKETQRQVTDTKKKEIACNTILIQI